MQHVIKTNAISLSPRTLHDLVISHIKKLSPREAKYFAQIYTTLKEIKADTPLTSV